jgi:hypothetical protein
MTQVSPSSVWRICRVVLVGMLKVVPSRVIWIDSVPVLTEDVVLFLLDPET